MIGPDNKPLNFANRIIKTLIDNHYKDEHFLVGQNDYATIRVVFRKLGGSWEKLVHGDVEQTRLLARVVKVWGKRTDDRERDTEQVYDL